MRRMRNNNLEIRIAAFVAHKKQRGLSKSTDTHIFLKLVEKQTAFSPQDKQRKRKCFFKPQNFTNSALVVVKC